MASIKIPALRVFLFFLTLLGATAYADQQKDSSVVVVGKVFCDTCLEHRLSQNGFFIAGASIAVECGLNRKTMTVSITGETDENGGFKVELPSNILQSADQLNKCWVKPRNSPLHSCNIPSTSAPSKLTLQSASNGVVTYSAGFLSYRHETVPPSCYTEDLFETIRHREMAETADQSSKAGQQTPTIPSLTNFPPLPSIPPLPGVPPFPKAPQLPGIPPLPSIPPLPKAPPLPSFSFPPFPVPSIPGYPPFQFPPIPFLTPPPPGQ